LHHLECNHIGGKKVISKALLTKSHQQFLR
jgi:hypothetical protein